MTRLVGIFGGSFDPIHHGHLRSMVELEEALGLDQLRLLPCHQSPHKGQPGASNEQRLAMLQLAIAGHDHWLLDQRELLRGGASYTVDSLRELSRQLADSDHLCLIMGTDAFAAFNRWHDWQGILALAHIVIMARPGEQLPATGAVAALLAERQADNVLPLRRQRAGLLLLQQLRPMDISSTDIRQRLMSGRSVRYLLPDSVWHYICEQGLYRAE